MIHDDPRVSQLWSLFSISCGLEAFLEVTLSQLEISCLRIPSPSHPRARLRSNVLKSAPWRHTYWSPDYCPLNIHSCHTMPEPCYCRSELACASCRFLAATSLRQVKRWNWGKLIVSLPISEMFANTVTELLCTCQCRFRPVRQCLRWWCNTFHGWLHIR